ncbi:MAG TPA: hypothetical protein VHH35_12650 [Pyrinomonadaceae bacterium]|nr:hypothetical protein [Pyrinomonadaceae bacterium]
MKKLLRQTLAAMVMMAVTSVGVVSAFDQGKGGDKRPKKERVRVIDGKGGNKPPPKPPKDDRGKKKP